MTDLTTRDASDAAHDAQIAARRQVLKLGAIGATAVVTVRPAMAQAAVSVLNCQIPVPQNVGSYVAADGSVVPAGTPGAFPGTARPFTGEEVKAALQGGSLPHTSYDQSRAYLNYIRQLRAGQSGFTCFASIQMPR